MYMSLSPLIKANASGALIRCQRHAKYFAYIILPNPLSTLSSTADEEIDSTSSLLCLQGAPGVKPGPAPASPPVFLTAASPLLQNSGEEARFREAKRLVQGCSA